MLQRFALRLHSALESSPPARRRLTAVERFFRDITTERLRRGVFTSVPELEAAINDHVAHPDIDPKPFVWTKTARDIGQKVIRADARSSSGQNETLHQLPAGDPTGSTFTPHEPDVHALPHPVAPNRLRAMVGAKLGPRPAATPAGTVQSRSPT